MDVESTSPSEPSLSTEDAPRPRRRGRRWLIIIGVVVVLLGVLIALAPTLVSTGPGTRLLLSVVNGYIPGKADVADLSAGWFSGTSVNGLTVADPDGRVVISIHTIAMPDFTLAKAVGGSAEYGTITVTRPEVTYEQYADGTNSITRALVKPGPTVPPPTEAEAPSKPSAPIRAKLVVSDAAIQCILPGQDPVGVEGLTVNAEIAALASITADAAATVRQGSSTGEINLKKLVAKNLFDAAGEFQPDRATINAEAKLARLPVALLDALAQADGKLLALLGDKAEINLSANGMLANLTGDVTVLTPRLTARTDFARTEKAVTLSAAVHTIIEPSVWTQLAAGKDGPILPAITKPVVVDLVLEKHTQPFEQERIDLAAILAKITLQPVDLVFDTTGGPATATLTKTGTQVTLTVPPLLVVTLWKHFEGQDETLAKVGLGDTVTVTAEVGKLTLSTGEQSGLSFKGGIRSPKIAVTGLPQVGAVTVGGLFAVLAYDTAGEATAEAAAKVGLTEISFPADKRLADMRLANVQIAMPAAPTSGPIKVTLAADLLRGDEKGTIAVDVDLTPGPTPIRGVNATIVGLPLELADVLADQDGRLVAMAGQTVEKLTLTANSKAADEEALAFDVAAETEHVTAKIAGTYAAQDRLELSDSSVALGLTPQSFKAITTLGQPAQLDVPKTAPSVSLQRNAEVTMTVAMRLPLPKGAEDALDLKNAHIQMALAVPQAIFKLAESGEVIAVKDFTAQVSSTDIAEQATVLAKSQFAAGAETGTLDSKTTVRQLVDPKGNLQLAEAGIDTDTRLKDIPLRLVDALAGLGGNLVRCVGPTLRQMDITAKSAGGEEPVNFGLAMRSDLVTADVNGVFTPGERLSFSSGSAATFTVTNDTLEMVQDWSAPTSQADKPVAPPVQRLTLQKPVTCRLNIAQADLAWLAPSAGDSAVPSGQPEPMRVDPAHTRLDVNLTGEPIALVMADSGKLVTVSNLKVTAATENPAKETVATLHLDVEVAKSGEPPAHGKLDSQTSLKNLVASDGLLQADKATIATNTSITNVPTQPIDALAGLNGKLYELLGPTLQASVVGTFHPNENSPMRVTLDSPNTQGDLRFVIDKDLVLRLEQDGRLLAKLTPELSKNLGLANPLFFQAVQSDKPIELTVESGTMAVPLSPMDLAAARVDGQLAMGTVTMQNGGLLRLTLMMLKQIGAVEEVGDTMKVTFTPLTVHLDRGIISSNDLWLSSDLITMGTQVLSVDLNPALESDGPFDAGKVPGDILIGLSGRDLLRISALKGVLDPTYIYELQVKGPINDLKPDFADFIIQIGKMKAQAQAAQQLARLGAGGALAARLLEQLPQGKNQAEIQKRWTNQPEPRAAQSQQTPPADSEKAPEGKAPEPDSKPALPRLPGL